MRSDSTVLFVSGDPAETIAFEKILNEYMVLKRAQDLAELKAVLGNGNHYDAVLCGGSFQKNDWKDALRYVLQGSPNFPLIISRRIGTEREWVEVLGAGAFDLLPAPHEECSVLPLLESAVASYEAGHRRNGLQRRLSPKQARHERSGASIASGQARVRRGGISHLRSVPEVMSVEL
jgi:DNA-binding NtrC family response regulator